MKNHIIALTVSLLAAASLGAKAQIVTYASDNFNEYTTPTPLVGVTPPVGGVYTQVGTSVLNPITASGGVDPLVATGQDITLPFSSPVAGGATTPTSVYTGFTLDVSTAGTGDYFLAYDSTSTGTSYSARVFTKAASDGLGYFLGLSQSSTGAYGTTEYLYSTNYNLVLEEDLLSATTATETAELYVNPTDPTTATAVLTASDVAGSTPYTSVGALLMRQGTNLAAGTESLDNIVVSNDFATAAGLAAPEPSVNALMLAGVLMLGFMAKLRSSNRA